MENPAAFSSEYVDWKLVKTRASIQIVFEIPLEAADHAYRVLGGMPDNSKSRWFGIARMEHDEQPKRKDGDAAATNNNPKPDTTPRPARSGGAQSWHTMSPAQQAGILCADKTFQMFIGACSEEEAAVLVRLRCGVTSRKDILPDNQAGRELRELVSNYRAWCREPEVV